MYRIVVVEDEEIVRKGLVITTDWESYDCQVIGEAKNGGEGLSLITKLKPDIVITDIRMPVMDGLQMIEKVYETYMPVTIMITAFNEFEYAKKGIDLSISDYLLKPFDDAQLDKCTLSEYLSQSRFKMRLQRRERDRTGKAEITRDRANLTETILRVCDSNNEKNGQNFISVFEVMKNKRIIG